MGGTKPTLTASKKRGRKKPVPEKSMPGDGRRLSDGEVVVRGIQEGVMKFREKNPGNPIYRALASCLSARVDDTEAQAKVLAVDIRSFHGEIKPGGAVSGGVELWSVYYRQRVIGSSSNKDDDIEIHTKKHL